MGDLTSEEFSEAMGLTVTFAMAKALEFVQLLGFLVDGIARRDPNSRLIPTPHRRDANSNTERSHRNYGACRLVRDLP